MTWQTVIGLEIHAQIKSPTKLFSTAPADFSLEPNSQVDLFDAAMPGILPVLNPFCIKQAVKSSLALNAKVHKFSRFDRKNYFYPDLPSGYQITQFHEPIATGGFLYIDVDGKEKKIRINRLHIEQDAGKLIHDLDKEHSFVDLNRSGVGLMEIVSEPDISSAEEAFLYVAELRNVLRYIDTCDGQMQEGSFRVDANISVNRVGEPLGVRCEVKNLNSLKFLRRAISYEVKRQREELESGGQIIQETRLFDSKTERTMRIRLKESTEEYRYFPDPDIPPIKLTQDEIDKIGKSIPRLPAQVRESFIQLGLSEYQAKILTSEKEYAEYFDTLLQEKCNPKAAANWVISELFGLLNKKGIDFSDSPLSPRDFARLILGIEGRDISHMQGKKALALALDGGAMDSILKGLKSVKELDHGAIKEIVKGIAKENPSQWADLKSGKVKIKSWVIGQVMKITKGAAHPSRVSSIIDDLVKDF